jgi:hypothetical protein
MGRQTSLGTAAAAQPIRRPLRDSRWPPHPIRNHLVPLSIISREQPVSESSRSQIETIQRRLAWPLHKDDLLLKESWTFFGAVLWSRRTPTGTCIRTLHLVVGNSPGPFRPSQCAAILHFARFGSRLETFTFSSALGPGMLAWDKLDGQ